MTLALGADEFAGNVAGVDEAGRGPLAGPVVAAAVVLDPDRTIPGLDDSKRLTAARREALVRDIERSARAFSVAFASVKEIDAINILQASLLAMRRACEGLGVALDHAIVDGKISPNLACEVHPVIKGDGRYQEVAAASILAKVYRDREMMRMHELYPLYGFERHKGYPTAAHMQRIAARGITPIHRRSFAPVRRVLEKKCQ